MLDLRAAPLPAYQDHHPSTTTKASSLTTLPPQLWSDVTESPPDVPSAPPPQWGVPQPPPPPWRVRQPTSTSMQPPPAAPALRTGDNSYDDEYTPVEAPAHVDAVPHAGTRIAVAAKAATPAIHAPLAAAPPPPRTAVLSSIPGETLEGSHTAALAQTVAQAVGDSNATNVRAKHMPLYRWTLYGPERKRQRTASAGTAPLHVQVTLSEAHEFHPSQEIDWTEVPDRQEMMRLRHTRNLYIKMHLQAGRSCQFRSQS